MLNPDRNVVGLLNLVHEEIVREKFSLVGVKTMEELNEKLLCSTKVEKMMDDLSSIINKMLYYRFIIQIPTLNRRMRIVVEPIAEDPIIIYLIEFDHTLTSYNIYQYDEVNNAKIKINKI